MMHTTAMYLEGKLQQNLHVPIFFFSILLKILMSSGGSSATLLYYVA